MSPSKTSRSASTMAWPRAFSSLVNLVVRHVTGGKCQIATLVSNDGARPLDRPLGKVAAVFDGHRFD